MTEDSESTVPELLRREAKTLIHAVARAIDDDRLESFPHFFTEDGSYKVASRFNVARGLPLAQINCTNRAMIADRIASLRQANIYQAHHYRHLISGVEISAGPGQSLAARSNYLVLRSMDDGSGTSLFSSGEYRDLIAVEGSAMKFRERMVVFDGKSIETLLVIPL